MPPFYRDRSLLLPGLLGGLFLLFVGLGVLLGAPPSHGRSLHVSEDRRQLVDAQGQPFFWLGDTAWSIIDQSTLEPSERQPSVRRYFETRKRQGFNVIQTHMLTNLVRGPIEAPNAYGHEPFVDGDFSRPKTKPGPNNDYWDYADTIVSLADEYGMYMAIVAAWTNSLPTDQHPMVRDPDVAYGYGRFLGRRYRDATHIVWLLGGDAFGRPDRKVLGDARLQMTRALAEGIADGAAGDTVRDGKADWDGVLMSYHPPGGGASSAEFFHEEPWLDFNMIQSTTHFAFRNYETVAHDYARVPVKPTLDAEVAYEYSLPLNQRQQRDRPGERISAWDVRRAAYWNVFSGALGHTYGHRNLIGWVCRGDEPLKWGADRPWFESLDAPGAEQMRYLKTLIESHAMSGRVPDTRLVAPESRRDGLDHVAALRGADGDWALFYLPRGGQVTVDVTALDGRDWAATWYNPRDGHAGSPQPFQSESARHTFQAPSLGDGEDWVLVLDRADAAHAPSGERPSHGE